MLSPGLDTDVSMVSKAGVVPDLWNVIGGKALVGSLTYSFIHSANTRPRRGVTVQATQSDPGPYRANSPVGCRCQKSVFIDSAQ